jgi:hypothetical protein
VDTGKLSDRASADLAETVTETVTSQQRNQQAAVVSAPQPNDRYRLVFASFMMLFIELALIRWVTSNNVYVTRATNFMLLASFLGIGIGFLNAKSSRDYLRWTPVALLALVAFVLSFPVILASLSGSSPLQGLRGTPALPQPVSLTIIFLLTAAVMVGIGQAVARLFVTFRPLPAYRLDILGSIAGIVVFSALSFMDMPPAGWGVIAGCGLVVLLIPRARWWQVIAIAGMITLLFLESVVPNQRWSPYNKLSISEHGSSCRIITVSANNIPYQAARCLTSMHAEKPFYFYPYRHVTRASLNNVLIIGAGTGNDVAVALNEGARHIDAVEIDPLLPVIGRDHSNRPYQSPRVTVHNADGREYLQNTNKKYNLIIFALPDSLVALTGQSALRLESYLLTEQSLAVAKTRLAPGGTFAMYNYYAPFLFSRYATTLTGVYHRAPCAEVGPPLGGRRLSVLTVHPGGAVPNCATYWRGARIAPATDDHPFPYLPSRSIPSPLLLMLGAILLGSLLLVRAGGGQFSRMRSYVDLAFMGAAFLLLETKNVVQFALLFGATWFVNALVFAGVLVAVYLAVETASRVRLPRPAVLYVALLAALVVAWVVPQASLLSLPMVPRFLAGSALAFAPVFLANLVFAQRFANVETSGTAFAVNLLGAMAGGALEYVALITGYRFILIVIAVLYGLAFVTGLRQKGSQPA